MPAPDLVLARMRVAPVFDVKANGLIGGIEHTGVGCEDKPLRRLSVGPWQGLQIGIRRAVGPLPEQANAVSAQVGLAYRIGVALMRERETRRGASDRRLRARKRFDQESHQGECMGGSQHAFRRLSAWNCTTPQL